MIFLDSRHSLKHLVRQDPVYKLASKNATHNKGDASCAMDSSFFWHILLNTGFYRNNVIFRNICVCVWL